MYVEVEGQITELKVTIIDGATNIETIQIVFIFI